MDHQNRTPDTGTNTQLLTLPEAAAKLRAPVATLRYWRHLGTGPHSFRLGRRVMYRQADIDRWVAEQHDLEGNKKVSQWSSDLVSNRWLSNPAEGRP